MRFSTKPQISFFFRYFTGKKRIRAAGRRVVRLEFYDKKKKRKKKFVERDVFVDGGQRDCLKNCQNTVS